MPALGLLATLFASSAGAVEPAARQPLPADVQAAVEAAAATGAPAEMLASKAREGLAKGVPPARIAGALQTWATGWVAAEQVVGASTGGEGHDDVVAAAAAAIRNGAGSDGIRRLAEGSLPAESLWTLTDVLDLGVPPEAALRLVELAAHSPKPDVALHALPEAARASLVEWGSAAPVHLEDALNHGSIVALSHREDGHGKSDAPGQGDKPDNGNHNGQDK